MVPRGVNQQAAANVANVGDSPVAEQILDKSNKLIARNTYLENP